jgi:site-specific DNA-adenine methylase
MPVPTSRELLECVEAVLAEEPSKLRQGDERLILALAATRTRRDAARMAGVSEMTIYRRLRCQAFARVLTMTRALVLQEATYALADLNGDLMTFYRVLKDPDLFGRLRHRLELTLFSEAEWDAARGLLAAPGGGDVERAAALFTLCRQSLSGRMDSHAPTVRTRLRGGRNDGVNGWWTAVDGLEAAHRRLRDVRVLCRPALDVIRAEDTPATCFYLDPPYLHETRTAKEV